MKGDLRLRLTQSVETAIALAEGLVVDRPSSTARRPALLAELRLPRARRLAARAAAADLLLQLAARRLPALHRARLAAGDRPRPARPRPLALDRRRRARAVVGRRLSGFYEAVIQAIAERYEIDTSTAVGGALRGAAAALPPRHERRADLRPVPQPDGAAPPVHARLRGDRLEPAAPLPGDRLARSSASGSRSTCRSGPCPVCKGARLKPEVLAVTVGGAIIHDVHAAVGRARRSRFVDELGLTPTEQLIGAPDRQGDPRAADVPRRRRRRLPARSTARRRRSPAARRSGSGSRRRSARSSSASSTSSTSRRSGSTSATTTRLIGTLERLRDLGNTVVVVEHDEEMMRRSDWLVDMGPGAGVHGGEVVAEGPAAKVARNAQVGHRPVPLRRARRSRSRSGATDERGALRRPRRRPAQPEGDRRRVPGRQVRLRHGRLRLRQVDARERDRLQGAREPAEQDAREARRARGRRGDRGLRQGDRDRPEADRPHAALEPGHLHRPVHAHPRAVLAHARGEGARLQAGPLLVQRARRPLRDVQGRRPDQDRDALPARRVRPVRDVQGRALQPRDARGALQGQVDRGRARDVGRGGARSSSRRSRRSGGGCRRCTTSGSTTSSSASRRRRSPAARRSA